MNAEGARNVVAAAREAGARRVVHTSTFDVFHAETGGTVSERAVADYPKGTAYERSKQRAEELVLDEAKDGIELVIANPSSVYGPGPWQGTGLDRAIRDAIRRRLPAVPPGGMTFVHVDDVAAGHLAAFERGTPGERYLLTDGYAPMREMLSVAVDEAGRGWVPPTLPVPLAKGDGGHGRSGLSRLIRRPPLLGAGQLHFLLWQARADSSKAPRRAGRRVQALGGGHPQHGALDDRGRQGLAVTYETLRYELAERVAVLTLDRPEQRNAVSRQMNAELHDAWRRFRDDDDAFVLVLTGAGSAFCAGWDLADAAEWPMPEWDEFRRSVYELPGACGYTRKVDVFKPVIAAVNGWAVAAGLETALLADIRIVAENAVFGALERRWNIVAGDGMTVRLPLAVGYAKAMELIITGRPVDAQEALRIGLANEVVPEGQALERALELAREIAALPQGAIRTDKETMVRNVGRTLEEQLRNEGEATISMWLRRDSHAIGARAFKEGRDPEWPHHGL